VNSRLAEVNAPFVRSLHQAEGCRPASLIRLIGNGLLVAVCLLLAACEYAAVEDDDVIRMGLVQAPATLDPRYATDAISSRICRLLYRGLVDFDAQLLPTADLATWQEIDPLHYRFTLIDELPLFTNGAQLTSADVVATFASVLREDSISPQRSGLAVIERFEAVDERVIDFYLNHADPLFPGRLTLSILPAESAHRSRLDTDQLIGNGAFELLGWPEPERVVLQRRADGQQVELIRVADATVRALKLIRGEIDLLQNDLPAEMITWLQQQPGVRIEQAPGSNYAYLGFNLDDPVSGDPRIREAVMLAIDRQEIIDALLGGSARMAESILPPDHWAGGRSIPSTEYDPARAAELVAEFRADGGDPTLTYKASTDALRLRIAAVIQQQLKAVGINVNIESHEWGTFYGDIKAGRFQLFSLSWVGIKMPDIFRYLFHSSAVPPQGANRGRFSDEAVDRLIVAAEAAPIGEQGRFYNELQQLLAVERPYVSLWYEDHTLVTRDSISGYRLSRDGNYDGLMTVQKGQANTAPVAE